MFVLLFLTWQLLLAPHSDCSPIPVGGQGKPPPLQQLGTQHRRQDSTGSVSPSNVPHDLDWSSLHEILSSSPNLSSSRQAEVGHHLTPPAHDTRQRGQRQILQTSTASAASTNSLHKSDGKDRRPRKSIGSPSTSVTPQSSQVHHIEPPGLGTASVHGRKTELPRKKQEVQKQLRLLTTRVHILQEAHQVLEAAHRRLHSERDSMMKLRDARETELEQDTDRLFESYTRLLKEHRELQAAVKLPLREKSPSEVHPRLRRTFGMTAGTERTGKRKKATTEEADEVARDVKRLRDLETIQKERFPLLESAHQHAHHKGATSSQTSASTAPQGPSAFSASRILASMQTTPAQRRLRALQRGETVNRQGRQGGTAGQGALQEGSATPDPHSRTTPGPWKDWTDVHRKHPP